jgi:hypothetical protein
MKIAFLALSILLAAPHVAQAQSHTVYTSLLDGIPADGVRVAHNSSLGATPLNAAVSFTSPAPPLNFTGQAKAFSAPGVLEAQVSMSEHTVSANQFFGSDARAVAAWSDEVWFHPTSSAVPRTGILTIQGSVKIEGNVGSSLVGESPLSDINQNFTFANMGVDFGNFLAFLAYAQTDAKTRYTRQAPGTRSFLATAQWDARKQAFYWKILFTLYLEAGGLARDPGVSGSSFSDFTVSWQAPTLSQDSTVFSLSDFRVTSDTGFNYLAAAPVPEPSEGLFMIAGLGAVLGLAQVRRRRL